MKTFLSSTVILGLSCTCHAFSIPSITRPAAIASNTALHESNVAATDRRGFLEGILATAATTVLISPTTPAYAADVDYKAVANDIMDLVKNDPDKGPSEFHMYSCLMLHS